jgi:hypothetical protein
MKHSPRQGARRSSNKLRIGSNFKEGHCDFLDLKSRTIPDLSIALGSNDRFGSKTGPDGPKRHFRFAPINGRYQTGPERGAG